MLKCEYSRISVIVAAVVLTSMATYGHAAGDYVMGVEATAPAPTYMPTAQPASAPSVNVSQIPPDYTPPPQQQAPSPAPVYNAPPPTYVAPPPPPTQVVLPATPPQFVFVPELGYYVATGLAYDMMYDGRSYYLYNNGYWYRTPYYGGPWLHVRVNLLPPLLVRHNIIEMHRFRDLEFRRYEREREHYRGRLHRPVVREREERHEERRGR